MDESVILYRTYERALAAREAQARAGKLALGQSLTTVDAYLADSWVLWGDGRQLVGPQERLLLMWYVLEASALPCTLGLAQALARFVQWNAGTAVLAEPLGCATADGEAAEASLLTGREVEALDVIRAYGRQLTDRGLVEPGEAARMLVASMPAAQVSAADPLFAPPAVGRWLEAIAGASLLAEQCPLPPLPEGVEARFSFPAGETAVPLSVRGEVLSALDAADALGCVASVVTVCAPDPLDLFEALAPGLLEQGIACACRATVPFGQTLTGRAMSAAVALGEKPGSWRQAATDFAYSPLSGIAPFEAQRLNAQWRSDRLFPADQAESQLRQLSSTFALFERLACASTLEDLDALADALSAASLIPSDRAVQEHAALQALRRLLEAGESLGVSVPLSSLAETLSVPLSVEVAPSGAAAPHPLVQMCPLNAMDSLAPASASAVIIADMTDAAFPISRDRSALGGLSEKLGCAEQPSPAERWRASFACAEQAAAHHFACIAPLRDAEQQPAYPAFLFDEFVAVLPEGAPERAIGGEELFSLPERYAQAAPSLGEETMVAALGRSFEEPSGFESVPAPTRGLLSALSMERFLTMVTEGAKQVPVLSPSAIETYAQCPYRWFVGSKVGIKALDEGFGPVEKGTFAHGVYKELFDRLAEQGIRRVDEGVLPAALDALEAVFEEQLALQPEQGPMNRLASADSLEQHEVALLRNQLRDSLRFMTALPSTFSVSAHEYELRPEDGIDYAGARLKGRVDRIDVDEEAGRFVVLDYKGSLNDHEAGFGEDGELDELAIPHKVQALIYAQALRSPLAGIACVGALYLSYRAASAAKLAAGSYNPVGYETAAVSKGSQVHAGFAAFLDAVERQLAPRIQALREGAIAPDPAPGACQWCPVPYCESRC